MSTNSRESKHFAAEQEDHVGVALDTVTLGLPAVEDARNRLSVFGWLDAFPDFILSNLDEAWRWAKWCRAGACVVATGLAAVAGLLMGRRSVWAGWG